MISNGEKQKAHGTKSTLHLNNKVHLFKYLVLGLDSYSTFKYNVQGLLEKN